MTIVPKLGFAAFRRRIIFRGVFVLLICATLGLAIAVLQAEKQRSYDHYRNTFKKTHAEVLAKLRHPAGQLAMLNPGARAGNVTPLRPLLLPYAALDFDDFHKAQQAVEMAGCSVVYENGASLCVAIGNNPYAGGYIYLVGSVLTRDLVSREFGVLDLNRVHRVRVWLSMRGTETRWIAPFEAQPVEGSTLARGRLTGFLETPEIAASSLLPILSRPERDFRGWLWQGGRCASQSDQIDCVKRAHYSIRLPVEAFRDALFLANRPVWPPQDLDNILVRVEFFTPDNDLPIFDSNDTNATPPLSLNELTKSLLPGEQLQIRKLGGKTQVPVTLKAAHDDKEKLSPWLYEIVRRLPLEGHGAPLETRETLDTAVGTYEVVLSGDVQGIDRDIGIVATRMLWLVGAMLAAISFAWLIIELGLIRRITLLTKRAAAVSYNVNDAQAGQGIAELEVNDLRGSDELGILAGGLANLLQRVKDDIQREHIRAQQEKDMWQAVGHEIMSPLQSLMVLHASPDDASHRYVQRMQQAVRVLYGTASPSEALAAATLQSDSIELNGFLQNIATNAPFAGIEGVEFKGTDAPLHVRADEFPLEDAITHILRNADRHRTPGTSIRIDLEARNTLACIRIQNSGSSIDPALLERIFEYGVSESADESGNANASRRGQGLFVAKTYMAKMGGTIAAENIEGGVVFTLSLQRVGQV